MPDKPETANAAIPLCCIRCAIHAALEAYYIGKGYEHGGKALGNGIEIITGLAIVMAGLVAGAPNEDREMIKRAFAAAFARELESASEGGEHNVVFMN